MAADCTTYGIELLNAKKQLQDKKSLQLLLVREATGEKKEFSFV